MNEQDVQAFWDAHPCGEALVGGAPNGDDVESFDEFFRRYDNFRYGLEAHIPRCLDALGAENKRVLEIGLGQGADAEQLIRRGASWTGVDLSPETVERVRLRLAVRGLPNEGVYQASALSLPFEDDSFDLVFSHGVLHHVPQIELAQREIARVLKPGGELVAMLYAKRSLNYFVAIALIRRLGLVALYGLDAMGLRVGGIYGEHVAQARRIGLRRYLRLSEFIHRNTDGPDNPYSKVYDLADVKDRFTRFEIESVHKEFMHAPPLPAAQVPLLRAQAGRMGWHLWVHMRARPC